MRRSFSRHRSSRPASLVAVASGLLVLAAGPLGCEEDGSAPDSFEEAGERVDDVIDDTADAVDDGIDEAGDSIEEAGDTIGKRADEMAEEDDDESGPARSRDGGEG